MAERLNGYRILILETREEAQFSKLLAEQGADVLQCPMFTINDPPDPAAVEGWIRGAIERPFDDLVLMTGEGLRRLVKAARRLNVEADFIGSLGRQRKFARGPKPGRALREIGLEPQVTTENPTSEGMIEILSRVDLVDKRVGVQLYPDKDHAADSHIVTAIEEMALGRIDAIALTNLGQIRRLFEVAQAKGFEARLREGLTKTPIASVGPAVSDELKSHGLQADIYPDNDSFFMRPLISAMATALAKKKPRNASH